MRDEAAGESMKERYYILDEIRGITLCSMILYHTVWDLVYIFGYDWKWYQTDVAFLWQQSICYTFILLSGFCFSLGKKKFKRGLIVFGAGIIISLVTEIFMPQNRIRFGVLTLLGSCMLIVALAEKARDIFRKKRNDEIVAENEKNSISSMVWAICSLILFVLTRRVNQGVLGFAGVTVARLPRALYNMGEFGNFLGFTEPTFYSTDYFSLIPWLFLFLTGYYLFQWMEEKQWKERLGQAVSIGAWFRPVGRHSLIIYLLHQPVVYGLLYLLSAIHLL